MTQSIVTIEGLTKLANDLTIQNAGIRNRLDTVEKQRDELLKALERIINDDRAAVDRDDYLFAKEAIAKAKRE